MTDVRVRPYTDPDRSRCLRVFESNVPGYFVPAERADFEAYLDDLPGPYLLLDSRASGVVACGGWAVEPTLGRADLCWGMVERSRHGQGWGRRLTEARLEAVRALGSVRFVALQTSQHTRGFYEFMGFECTEVVPDGCAPGLDRCEMRLDLTAGD